MKMVAIRFAGDPKRYDFANTTGVVMTAWLADGITDKEMFTLLHEFKLMATVGPQLVPFLKDLDSDTVMETALWFGKYGLGPNENR